MTRVSLHIYAIDICASSCICNEQKWKMSFTWKVYLVWILFTNKWQQKKNQHRGKLNKHMKYTPKKNINDKIWSENVIHNQIWSSIRLITKQNSLHLIYYSFNICLAHLSRLQNQFSRFFSIFSIPISYSKWDSSSLRFILSYLQYFLIKNS